ncbi:MAG: four helix bundle protein [Ignavibacteriaceae bacterium]|jgi:four helix bundle protein|nr:four helix bundle protein [Ignavibacteriaceae bacterium]MCW9065092.1 four helix bundle protein [Ignavibacteriaceae bacterium]
MSSKSRLEDLEVYKISLEISDTIWDLVIRWDNFSRNNIGGQLLRAIDSVGANISEGYGRGSKIDNARFVKMARGSLFETKHWLILAKRRKLLSDSDTKNIVDEIENLLPRLSAYINYLSSSSTKK